MPLRSRRHRLDDAIEQLAGLAYYAKLVTLTLLLAFLAGCIGGCPGASAAEPTLASTPDGPTLRIVVEGVDQTVQLRDRSALRPTPMPGPPQAMPVPVIDGPAAAEPGDLVVLSAERSSGDAMCWVAVNIEPGRYLEIEQGRKLVFATGKQGRYTFVLIAASLIDGQVTALTARHEVTIGTVPGPGPAPPGPGPGPDPQPDPPQPQPLPDGRYKLAEAARDWAESIPQPARGKAAALAGALDATAAQIAAGVLRDFEAVNAAAKSANNAALGSDRPAWEPFFQSLDKRLGELWDAGQVSDVADMADVFRETATGLRAAKGR